MITISLSDVRFFAYHGVFPQERRVGNEFSVDIDVIIPEEMIDESDQIKNTVSYADIYDIIKVEMDRPCELLETVLLKIRKRIRDIWPDVKGGKIKITKISPPISGFIGSASVTLDI